MPTRRLIELVVARGRLAELLDCYLGCSCCEEPAICQVLLDKLLYDTDRAIDLYALGADPVGDSEPEWRAAAYGLLIDTFLANEGACVDPEQLCLPALTDPLLGLQAMLNAASAQLFALGPPVRPIGTPVAVVGAPLTARQEIMRDELCLQREMDRRWSGLLATMAPSCVGADRALTRIDTLIGSAIGRLGLALGTECPEVEARFPPTVEQSLQLFDDLPQTPLFQTLIVNRS